MAQTYDGGFVTVVSTGINIATSGTSASAVLPNNGAGGVAKYVRVSASAPAYVRLGKSSATAVNTDMMVQPGDSVIMATAGNDLIAALQVSAAGVVQVSPMENQ